MNFYNELVWLIYGIHLKDENISFVSKLGAGIMFFYLVLFFAMKFDVV